MEGVLVVQYCRVLVVQYCRVLVVQYRRGMPPATGASRCIGAAGVAREALNHFIPLW